MANYSVTLPGAADFFDPTTGQAYYYYATPKADGGWDFFKVDGKGTPWSMSLTDWAREQNNIDASAVIPNLDSQLSAQEVLGANTSNTGTSGVSAAQQAAQQKAALISQRDALAPQFEQLYAKALSDLKSEYDTKKSAADKAMKEYQDTYQTNVNSNDKAFGDAWQQYQNAYSARGIGDSSYYDKAVLGLKNDFNTQYQGLNKSMGDTNTQYNDYLGSLDKWANDTRGSYDVSKNNFYNMDNPMIGSFSDMQSYSNNLLNSYQNSLGNKSINYSAANFAPTYATPKYNATGSAYQGFMTPEDEKNKYLYGVR